MAQHGSQKDLNQNYARIFNVFLLFLPTFVGQIIKMKQTRIVHISTLIAALILLAACHEMPRRIDNGRIVASVGETLLRLGEVKESLPEGVSGQDSLDFVSTYIDRWIARQVKVREAERRFSSSVGDVEAMVNDYRQSLLTHKLDQHYIDESRDTPFSEADILLFYNRNTDLFKLNESIVKGTIIKLPKSYNNINSLKTMMQKSDKDSRYNLLSICDRIEDGEVYELDLSWITYDKFIAHLPIVRDSGSGVYMKRSGVQTLSDNDFFYMFEIVGYRSEGYVAPLEVVKGEVERILTAQHHHELIRRHDQTLYNTAKRSGEIKIYIDESELEM